MTLRPLAVLTVAAACACGPAVREPRTAGQMIERATAEHLWNTDRRALAYAERAAALPGASVVERARALRLSGSFRLAIGDAVGAREKLAAALESAPGDPETASLLAQAWRDEPRTALDWADRALAGASAWAPARRAALLRLRAAVRADLEDAAGVEADSRAALALEPDDLESLRSLARLARRRGGDAAAWARAAEAAAEDVPEWARPAARRFAARVWMDLDDDARAAAALRRVLELEPFDREALLGLAEIAARRPGDAATKVAPPGRVPRPAEDSWADWDAAALARAEALDPDGPESRRLRAARAREQGRRREAAAEAARLAESLLRAPLWQQAAGEAMAARMQLDLGSEREAAVRIATVLRLDPRSPAAARLQTRLGETRQLRRAAVDVLGSAVTADQLPDPAAALALGYREAADARLKLGDPEGARAALDLALAARPGDSAALTLRERVRREDRPATTPPPDPLVALEAAIRSGRLTAEETLAAALTAGDDSSAAAERKAAVRAAAVERLGAADPPPGGLRRLAAQAPDDAGALDLLVRAEERHGPPAAALADVDRLVAVSTGPAARRASALTRRARLRLAAGDRDGARGDLRAALALDAANLDALEALLRAEADAPERALAEVESRWPAAPSPAARWTALRGLARLRAKGWAAARADLEAAFASDPAAVCRAEGSQAGRDRFDAGYFDLCLRAFPRDAGLYCDRGVARFRAGRRTEAAADFRRALELDPGNVSAKASLDALR